MNKTTKPAALAGIEPVFEYLDTNWLYSVLRHADKNPDYFPDVAEGKYTLDAASADDVAKLYSAATVERLVWERDGWIDSAREFSTGMEYYRDQLDACARHIGLPCFTADDGGVHEEPLRAKVAEEVERLVQERDEARSDAAYYEHNRNIMNGEWVKVKEQLAAMTQERDKCIKECNEFWGKRSDQDFELICALQASEQQLREALEICKKEIKGDKWDALYIDGVLAKHSPEDEVEHARRMV